MKVIVQLHNGQVSLVEQSPGVEVEIRDYNVPDDWEGNILTDNDGDKYECFIFPREK